MAEPPASGQRLLAAALDDTWDKPQLYIGHYRVFEDRSAILLPLREADDMANLMTHLKHADIAALIRQAEDGAR